MYTVILNTYFSFLGGSLRFRDAVEGKTNIRFGYQFSSDFDWDTSHWRWSFGYAGSDTLYNGKGVNKTAKGISNLVITDLPLSYYERDIRVQLIFEVVYDDVAYTVYDTYQYRSVRGVGEAILEHETESLESIAYAQQILAEIEAAG